MKTLTGGSSNVVLISFVSLTVQSDRCEQLVVDVNYNVIIPSTHPNLLRIY